LYELAKHPEVQDKLYEQVTSVLGDKEADGESLQKLPYLGQLIKEALRYYSVVPYTTRAPSKDVEILGYNIPAKTTILGDQKLVGFDPQYFSNPHEFNPDRWSTDDIHPFAQLPFGFGPRSCWGRRFAEIEIKVLLTKLSRQFIMKCDDDVNTKLPVEYASVGRPNAPIKIKYIPR
jgi:cytochrome P450